MQGGQSAYTLKAAREETVIGDQGEPRRGNGSQLAPATQEHASIVWGTSERTCGLGGMATNPAIRSF